MNRSAPFTYGRRVRREAHRVTIAGFIRARHFGRGRSLMIRRIVIHITDGAGDARRTAEYFANPGDGREVSSHYVVGRDGLIWQCVADSDTAYHAHSANAFSIGIENSGRTPGERGESDPGLAITAANYQATAELCVFLCRRHGLPIDRAHIVGHNEVDPATTHKKCPTGAWDWRVFWPYVVKAAA